MCQPASFIIAKDFIPRWSPFSESHTNIRKDLKLPDNTDTRIFNVQVELSPENGNLRTSIKNWKFRVDQDLLPEWWDAKKAEKAVREEIKHWKKTKLIVGKKHVKFQTGNFYVYNSTVIANDNSTVKADDNSTVIANGNSNVIANGNSNVIAWDNSNVEANGTSIVIAYGNSTVKAKDNSTVIKWSTKAKVSIKEGADLVDKTKKA